MPELKHALVFGSTALRKSYKGIKRLEKGSNFNYFLSFQLNHLNVWLNAKEQDNYGRTNGLKSSWRHFSLVADCWHVLLLPSFNVTLLCYQLGYSEMGFGETRVLTSKQRRPRFSNL